MFKEKNLHLLKINTNINKNAYNDSTKNQVKTLFKTKYEQSL